MKVSTLGIDLAKNVFQLHGVDHEGHTILRKKLTRAKFVQFVIQLEPCLIGMEAAHPVIILRDYSPAMVMR